MELKKITLTRLRKLIFDCKSSTNDCLFIKEIDLIISDDPKNKKIKHEKIKFIYTGITRIYRKKKNIKKLTHSWNDYKAPIIVEKWLENKKNKQENNDLIYIQGLIKYKGDKSYTRSSLQVCDNNEISLNCVDGSMVYTL